MDGDGQLLLGLGNRHDAVLARERPRQRAGDDVEVELERIDPDEAKAGEGGERLANLRLGGQTQLDDELHDRRRAAARLTPHALGLVAGERFPEDENLQEVADVGRRGSGRR